MEPEGWNTDEVYLTGLFTSLPEDVQIEVLHSIPGLEQAQIADPITVLSMIYIGHQLAVSLENKLVSDCFAGQVNGTSGYEEAGWYHAGINAALC